MVIKGGLQAYGLKTPLRPFWGLLVPGLSRAARGGSRRDRRSVLSLDSPTHLLHPGPLNKISPVYPGHKAPSPAASPAPAPAALPLPLSAGASLPGLSRPGL